MASSSSVLVTSGSFPKPGDSIQAVECPSYQSIQQSMGVLTPPTTPEKDDVERKRFSVSIDSKRLLEHPTEQLKTMLAVGSGLGVDPTEMVGKWIESGEDIGPLSHVPETALPYGKEYQLNDELGHGAWSTVYSASEGSDINQRKCSTLLTPPATPEKQSASFASSRLLAVKVLSRRDGKQILEREARILTYLHSHSRSRHYLVPFHGFDLAKTSIIMTAVTLNLEVHAKAAAHQSLTTATMFDPVIGASQWSDLALSLISGLAFLKDKGCVHGDIKPANILLRASEDPERSSLTPFYCDFSSSHVLDSSTGLNGNDEVNAITTDYTAPELLQILHPRNGMDGGGRATATFASDVFALGVTLIFAAAGESPYAGARLEAQKTAMVLEGRPMDFARGGHQASRSMAGRAVDRALKGALVRDITKRYVAEEWEEVIRTVTHQWRESGWKQGGK
ncbi:uncharacterized protein KY384_006037 [Bacidia gigantensis]|uniref:uncharacterized protein n=1 Tax=Bacidia gigantensis TaxID=2732470 RepID=UPI001D05A61F|nr:uncharacterized protein KY384_006037 [Bacidia gigantensis]KAG8529400.1 hypothetical protein KY384_006037 [Bacidia gigantensis]